MNPTKRITRVYDAMPPMAARACQFCLDIVMLVGSFGLAYLLRFDFALPAHEIGNAARQVLVVVAIQTAMLALFGVHRILWRHVSLSDAQTIATAMCLCAPPLILARFALPLTYGHWRIPLSVIAIDTVLVVCGTIGMRSLRRAFYDSGTGDAKQDGQLDAPPRRVLLLGAGHAGRLAAREIARRSGTELRVIGFVDNDPRKRGSVVSGLKILGTNADVPLLVRAFAIDEIVITSDAAPRSELRKIVELCESAAVKVRIMPAFYELLQGRLSVDRLRDVNLANLLGRPPVDLDKAALRQFISGKVVMVSGAGGSIGSELARQIAGLEPARLVLVERSEYALFTIQCELKDTFPKVNISPVLADIGDARRMRHVFANRRPNVVVHAAAHKHVPLIEDNPTECVTNNVLGTHRFAELAGEFGAETFVLISTDKAVRPTSLMGASKRVAELAIQALDQRYETRYVAVRFGNVIGSAGSVIPMFLGQIRKGGPVTVTHPDMVRYFMTIPEASELVLEAATIGLGGEIFVLDMGEPVHILDLAKDLIRLSGYKPFEDIEIVYSGVRPGEKLVEELQLSGEAMDRTRHPKIFIGKIEALPSAKVEALLHTLDELAGERDEQELRRVLSQVIPESNLLKGAPLPKVYAAAASASNGVLYS